MRTPDFSVTLDGQDLTSTIKPRLVSLTLTETRGDEADQLDIVLDDSDGQLAIPGKGVMIQLLMGWRDTGLVDKGTFKVDEVSHGGTPDLLTLRGRSAPMMDALRTRNERSWHQMTIRDIVGTIAAEHRLTPRVGSFGDTMIDHIDQTNESDISFLNRLGKRFDAVATVKKNALLFLPISADTNSKGQPLPTVTLRRGDGDAHQYTVTGRETYSGVRAYWHNKDAAQRESVLVGKSDNAKQLRESHASQADALDAANAEWLRIQRGAATLEYTLAMARPDITPQMRVRIPDMKQPIGSTQWLVAKCTHSMSSSFTTRLEMETKGAQDDDADDVD